MFFNDFCFICQNIIRLMEIRKNMCAFCCSNSLYLSSFMTVGVNYFIFLLVYVLRHFHTKCRLNEFWLYLIKKKASLRFAIIRLNSYVQNICFKQAENLWCTKIFIRLIDINFLPQSNISQDHNFWFLKTIIEYVEIVCWFLFSP